MADTTPARLDAATPLSCAAETQDHPEIKAHSDGLVQERCNSSALAMESRLSCTNP